MNRDGFLCLVQRCGLTAAKAQSPSFSADHFVRRRRDSVSTLQLGCRDSVPVVVQFGGTTLRALADWASQPRWVAPGWQSACILIADQMLLISKETLIVLRTRRVRAS